MDRNAVLAAAIKHDWEPWPEPTDEQMGLLGEPPITLDEMHSKAYSQKLALKS